MQDPYVPLGSLLDLVASPFTIGVFGGFVEMKLSDFFLYPKDGSMAGKNRKVRMEPQRRPIPWAPDYWSASIFGGFLTRNDGVEIMVRCVMDDPHSEPHFRALLTDEPALTAYGADPAFVGEDAAAVLAYETRTPQAAVAEVERRWPYLG